MIAQKSYVSDISSGSGKGHAIPVNAYNLRISCRRSSAFAAFSTSNQKWKNDIVFYARNLDARRDQ